MKNRNILGLLFCLLIAATILPVQLKSQDLKSNPALDEKVKKFLADHSGQWHDMNIPTADGQLLYDLISSTSIPNSKWWGVSQLTIYQTEVWQGEENAVAFREVTLII